MIVPHFEGRTLTKGHGAGNDFILVPDFDAAIDISADDVAAVCDRHKGIGADGLIRVVRTEALARREGIAVDDPSVEWSMDYRNADGSVAEMCGNGVRVFVHYLRIQGIISLAAGQSVAVATRGGTKRVSFDGTLYTVDMGPYELGGRVSVEIPNVGTREGCAVAMPNPHVVVRVSEEELAAADFHRPPVYDPHPIHGTNLELVSSGGVAHMRVLERGVGETLACGTGTCAVAVALRASDGSGDGQVEIESPGGHLSVRLADGRAYLTGPAVLVAEFSLLGIAGL